MKKSEEHKKSTTKRHFSTLFKQQAVERADKDGVAQVAKDLGIPWVDLQLAPQPGYPNHRTRTNKPHAR